MSACDDVGRGLIISKLRVYVCVFGGGVGRGYKHDYLTDVAYQNNNCTSAR